MLEKIDAQRYERIVKTAKQHPNVDVTALEAAIAVLLIGRRIDAAMDANLGRYNLSKGRFSVLMELGATPSGRTPADLADRVEVSRGTMTGLLDCLVKDGLVVREPSSEDRRTILIKITQAGIDLTTQLLPENFRRMAILMQHLSFDDKDKLVDLLAKVNAGLKSFSAE